MKSSKATDVIRTPSVSSPMKMKSTKATNVGDTPRPDRAHVQAFAMMTTVASRLKFSSGFKDAWSLYKRALPHLSRRGYNHDVRPAVSVCLYLAGLTKGKRRSLEDIFHAVRFINPHGPFLKEECRELLKLLVQSIQLELKGAVYDSSSSSMKRHSVLLGMGSNSFYVSMEVLEMIEGEFATMEPDVLEASSLLIAAENVPVFDVSIITGVNKEAIDDAHRRIRAFLIRKEDQEELRLDQNCCRGEAVEERRKIAGFPKY